MSPVVTVQFKPYGVQLDFTPTITGDGAIDLKVAPEVSSLDFTNAVTLQGFLIPALSQRKAETEVVLRDGQSFAIAGLFQQGYNNTVDQFPGLGNLPVLGALFKSTNWQHQQTELVIIVTPHLMSPTDHIEQLPNPMAGEKLNAIDQILVSLMDKSDPTGAAKGHNP